MAKRNSLLILQEDLDVLSAEVLDLATLPPEAQSLALEETRKRIRRVRMDIRKVASEMSSDRPAVVTMADNLLEPVENSLSAHPVTTITAGFALGFILGLNWRKH